MVFGVNLTMLSRANGVIPDWEWRLVLASSALFTAGFLTRGLFTSKNRAHIIESPRKTLLPKLTDAETSALPYAPDCLPGARDVRTPFGDIRVYEFGPETGRKVLMVHGISTPCLSLGAVAHGLVEQGCRVMLFDLFGRGYSDAPQDLDQDARLFTTEILLVLASSTLSWTGSGSGKFSLVGYSLGGGISVAFTSYFPDLVDKLILIAPAGLMRDHHISRSSRILYSNGVIPESLLNRMVKERLKTPLYKPKTGQSTEDDKLSAATAVQAEAKLETNSRAPLSKTHPNVTISDAVVHQVDHHDGFVPSFMSSIRYGPIQNQHDKWKTIAQDMSIRSQETGKQETVLIISADHDPIIDKVELTEDATSLLGDHVQFHYIDAAHDVVITKPEEVIACITEFWQ